MLVLTILAMLLVLLLAMSAVLHVETRSSGVSRDLALARQNALLGLDVAVGQLQLHAGKDQAVTFPATTFYPTKNVTNASGPLFDDATFGYRANATTAARKTFLTPSERATWNERLNTWWEGKNPRWTGIADASLRRDGTPSEKFGEPKRDQLPVWLVSGNEKIAFDPAAATSYPAGYQTPDTELPTPVDPNASSGDAAAKNVVWLVNDWSAGRAAGDTSIGTDLNQDSFPDVVESADGLDGRVKATRQPIVVADGSTTSTNGHYAYWVGDESVKANFAVRDPWFESKNPTSAEYRNRLQVPQRIGWENMTGFEPATFDINDPKLESISTSREITLLEEKKPRDIFDASKRNFHSLTAFSRSLLTDTALGGLKKDLTVFLDGGSSPLTGNDPIADRALYASDDPRFGTINNGFPRVAGTTGLPLWETVKKWYDNDESNRAPALANFQLFTAFTHKNGELRMHFLPILMLWNPYDSTLSSATYTVKVRQSFGLWHFGVGVRNDSYVDPPPPKKDTGTPPVPNPAYNPNDPFDLINGYKLGSYYITPIQGFHSKPAEKSSWFYRDFSKAITHTDNKFFKGFGVDLEHPKLLEWKKTNNVPVLTVPEIPNYKFAPFDRGPGTDNVVLPTDAQATWVTYRISTSFAPGEVKVFTVDSEQQVDPALLHAGSQTVDLQNIYYLSGSESYWFPVASGLQREPGAAPESSDEVRWFGEILQANTPSSFSISLQRGGNELWKYYFTGGGVQKSWIRSQYSGEPQPNSPSDPGSWKKVYDFDDWRGTSKAVSDARYRDSPLVAIANFGINPFLASNWKIYDSGAKKFRMESLAENYRAFAHSNISARTMDPIDRLDLARSKDAQNNPAAGGGHTFNTLRRIEFRAPIPKWYDNQVDGDNGFTLFGWQKINPTLKTLGLSKAAIRQARASANLLSLGQLQQVECGRVFLAAWLRRRQQRSIAVCGPGEGGGPDRISNSERERHCEYASESGGQSGQDPRVLPE